MKEQIENLIVQQKYFKDECFEQANELLKINKEKLSEEEKRLLEDSILVLEKEIELRLVFANELEKLL